MAYKYTKGKVFRGDIYNEDDAQGNTYIDWNEDAFGVVAGGTTNFVVSSSTVGIGTATPDYTLDVAGNVGFDEYIYHNDDSDTYIRFQSNEINLECGAGGKVIINKLGGNVDFKVETMGSNRAIFVDASANIIRFNDNADNVDFIAESENYTHMLFLDADEDKIGIGEGTPTSTFHVSGSHAGNLFSSATSFTMNSTHFMVAITGDTMTGTLPAASGCGGRIYHIFNTAGGHEGASIEVSCSGGDTIDGSGALTIDSSQEGGGNSSVSLVSDGDDAWLIFGQYSPSQE